MVEGHLAFVIGAVLVVAVIGVALTVLRSGVRAGAEAEVPGDPAYSEAATSA